MKLLIVDDHAGMRALIREFVAHIVSDVRECADGNSAMRACLVDPPDVMTLDLSIGEPDGFDVLDFTRQHCPAVNVVVVTQFLESPMRERLRKAGAPACFSKDDLGDLRAYLEALRRLRGKREAT